MIDAGLQGWLPADPALRLAVVAGSGVYLAALLQVLVVAWLHLRNRRRKLAEVQLRARFTPVLLHTIEGLPHPLPSIAVGERPGVLLQWLFFVESTRGPSRDRLRDLGRALGFPAIAQAMLRRSALGGRLLATATLGRLQHAEAWDDLARIADGKDTVLSLLAIRSLTQIEPASATRLLLARLPGRQDWPSARLNALMRELAPEVTADAIVEALASADDADVPRLLGLLEIVRPSGAWRALERFLDASHGVDALAAALRMVDDPRGLPAVRRLVGHESWVVRTKAASALGRIGEEADVPRLQTLLGDTVWWVRFRAAQALLALPFLDRARLAAIGASLDDRFARDMLTQTLAERGERA